ncbi:MAG: Na/Pi cotransporter family protein, partial [Clostridia bacterium]|nr:Na/Pi cotransporter family protein [Clostridia bacterium]
MTFQDVLTMLMGLVLFLFGMNLMGEALEKRAGNKLKDILATLTSSKIKGLLLGMIVTCVIQSSSATTVMAVGFVNSGLMTLSQAIPVIMGANIGTTITSWILSLSGISGSAWYIVMLKPSTFVPVLAVLGIVFYMFLNNPKKKDIGLILIGFATLMFGMETMSGAVKVLKDVPEFAELLVKFENPILGVIAGAVITGIIQSSSASVGILQALAGATGAVTIGATVPIIMGQNIGTCVTAMISSVGANKNAKRTAAVHLYFNIIGTVFSLIIYTLVTSLVTVPVLSQSANEFSIAVVHTAFNVICTLVLFPFASGLEKLATITVGNTKGANDKTIMLDERLITTPAVAITRCKEVVNDMSAWSVKAISLVLDMFGKFDE